MKKIIALLLALVMVFSVTAVAFAADENENAEPATETTAPNGDDSSDEPLFNGMTEEELIDFIMNLPAGLVFQGAKMTLKVAKVAIKIALVLDKIHIIDLSPIKNAIYQMVADMIKDLIENQEPTDPEVPEVPETEAAA